MKIETTIGYPLTPVRMAVLKKKIYKHQMLERVWRKGNPLALLLEMYIDATTMENSMEIP